MVRFPVAGVDRLRSALLLALGVPVVACGARTFADDSHGSGGASADGSESDAPAPFACENPRAVPGDVSRGLVACDGDWQHRRNEFFCPADPQFGGVLPEYGCETDADCASNQLCECRSPVGQCVTASCQLDSDCGAGKLCALSVLAQCNARSYHCQTSLDECISNRDCPKDQFCTLNPVGGKTRECKPASCFVGRPFLVAGDERRGGLRPRSDWAEGTNAGVEDLSPWLRERAASAWAEMGRMEHASVASFARFTVELMVFRAPSKLMEDALRALGDEIKHAKLAFAMASRYARRAIGPGVLEVSDVEYTAELATSVEAAVLEGCIGETVAALEAATLLATAEDPDVRAVLTQVAKDEARHAELAFRYVAWAIGEQPMLARSVEALWQRERMRGERPDESAAEGDDDETKRSLAKHGVMSADERRALRRCVFAEVLVPCFAALVPSEMVGAGHAGGFLRAACENQKSG